MKSSNRPKSQQSSSSSSSSSPAAPAPKSGVGDSEFRERGKSKRAVLKDGGIVRAREAREVAGGVIVKEWQRLPRQLVQEYCQREKRPRPFYPRAFCNESNKFRVRCVVGDPKGKKEKDLMFCSNESFSSVNESEEWSSLLALKHLTPNLPLEQKLPDPYKAGWISLGSNNPMVTNERAHVSLAEQSAKKEVHRQRANVVEARRDARMKAIPQVHMNEENRHFIEQILKSSQKFNENNQNNQKSSPRVHGEEESKIVKKLVALQFDRPDIDRAIHSANSPDFDSVLNWLLIHLPESRLPSRFDPRGAQFEVIQSGANLQQFWATMYAMPAKLFHQINQEMRENEEKIAAKICQIIYKNDKNQKINEEENISSVDEIIEEEIAVIESIFGSDCSVMSARRVQVKISNSLTVEFWASKSSNYPSHLPVILIHQSSLSALERLQLLLSLVSYASDADLIGRACLYDLCSHLQSHSDEMIERAKLSELEEPKEFQQHKNILTAQQREDVKKQTEKNIIDDLKESGDENFSSNFKISLQPNREKSQKIRSMSEARKKLPDYLKILQTRRSLPMFNDAPKAIKALETNRAILLTAATGAGKSTQFPSMLLDHFIDSERGSEVNIICTQPRRISAIGLATRVAEERADKLGDMVGYRIKNESRISSATRLSFVTSGILLRQLSSDPASLSNYSHILIDEVHERSVEIDTLMFILKREISKPESKIRIVLMSATVAAQKILNYFNIPNSAHIDTPGRAFPVTVNHLEDILELTKFVPSHKFRSKGIKSEELTARVAALGSSMNVRSSGRSSPRYSEATLAILSTLNFNSSDLDCDLICSTIIYAIDNHHEGAILTFLPSVESINHCINITRDLIKTRGWEENDFWLLPLHASLTPGEQTKVFRRPNAGIRKLIFSTNIAETSVTIDDVVVVIDSGKMKSLQFDPAKSLSSLIESFVAQSNAVQRTGRAGRVQSGFCYRAFTQQQFQQFSPHQIPELHRVTLDHLCLQLPGYSKNNKIDERALAKFFSSIFSEFLDPPPVTSINSAIFALHRLGAIKAENFVSATPENFLTSLGKHIAAMPVNSAKIGRMLLMSAAFDCVTPVTVIAAFLLDRDPFIRPSLNDRELFSSIRANFVHHRSDHLTWMNAFNGWRKIKNSSGETAAKKFAHDNFLHHLTLTSVLKQQNQFKDFLRQSGFLSDDCDRNSSDPSIILSAVCSGLYPSVVKVKFPATSYQQTAHGSMPKPFKAQQIKYLIQQTASINAKQQASITNNNNQTTKSPENGDEEIFDEAAATPAISGGDVEENLSASSDSESEISSSVSSSSSSSLLVSPRLSSRVFLHPKSVNFSNISYESLHLVYHELVETSKQFVADSSMIPSYSLLLFGGELKFDSEIGIVRIDDWIEFRASPRICALIVELRSCIDNLFEQKLHQTKNLNIGQSPIIQAALKLVKSAGF